jgi:hypothetical protein
MLVVLVRQGRLESWLNRASSGNQVVKENHYRNDEEQMDQAPRYLENHPAQEPRHNQDDSEPHHGQALLQLVVERFLAGLQS